MHIYLGTPDIRNLGIIHQCYFAFNQARYQSRLKSKFNTVCCHASDVNQCEYQQQCSTNNLFCTPVSLWFIVFIFIIIIVNTSLKWKWF